MNTANIIITEFTAKLHKLLDCTGLQLEVSLLDILKEGRMKLGEV